MSINIPKIAEELAGLSSAIDPNDWPHRTHILYELGEYGIWAEICELAGKLADDKTLKIYFLIETVNGLRRLKNFIPGQVLSLLTEAERQISQLPDNPSKSRLLELVGYHSGLVYHLLGNFLMVAQYHRKSAEAADNERGKLLALYHKDVAMLNAALMKGRAGSYYGVFEKTSGLLLDMLSTDSSEDRRWIGNVYWHQAMYGWVGKGSAPDPEKLEYLKELSAEIVVFTDVVILLEAMCQLKKNPEQALKTVQKISEEAAVAERSLGMLIHAYSLIVLRRKEEAKAKLEEIIKLSKCEFGWHLVKTVAESLM